MYSKLFHKDVYMPDSVKHVCELQQKNMNHYFFSFHLDEHLEKQAIEDRSHKYLRDIICECLDTLKDNPREVFEVEVSKSYNYFKKSNWFITKFCVRIPYDSDTDICVAIRPQYENAIAKDYKIITAWKNAHNDAHYTLDESKYATSF